MQLHRKISCVDCRHYSECSKTTRLFVNYCGSRSQDIEEKMDEAATDCRAKRGKMFKRVLLSPVVDHAPDMPKISLPATE